jgi:hypothetical protein
MRLLLIYGFVLLSTQSAWAQPGYLGKKILLGYSVEGFSALDNYNANNEFGLTRLNIIHSPRFEMAISRRSSIGATVQFGKTGFNGNRSIEDVSISELVHGILFPTSYSDKYKDELKVNHQAVRVHYRRYKLNKGAIAPVGSYVEYGAGYQQYEVVDRQDGYTYFEGGMGLLCLGFGKSRVILDKVVLDLGVVVTASIPAGSSKGSANKAHQELHDRYSEKYNDNIYDSSWDDMTIDARLRMVQLNGLNFRLGISGLLF